MYTLVYFAYRTAYIKIALLTIPFYKHTKINSWPKYLSLVVLHILLHVSPPSVLEGRLWLKDIPCGVREWHINSAFTHQAAQRCNHKELRWQMPHITLSHTQIHTCSTRPVTPTGSFDGGDHKAVFIVCSCRLCAGSFRADGVGVAPSNMTSNFIKASQEQLVLFFCTWALVPGSSRPLHVGFSFCLCWKCGKQKKCGRQGSSLAG